MLAIRCLPNRSFSLAVIETGFGTGRLTRATPVTALVKVDGNPTETPQAGAIDDRVIQINFPIEKAAQLLSGRELAIRLTVSGASIDRVFRLTQGDRALGPIVRECRQPDPAPGALRATHGDEAAIDLPGQLLPAPGALRATHGEWQIRCDTPPLSASSASSEQCALVQSVAVVDRPNIALTVIVLRNVDTKALLLRVLVPLGVLLPSGLGLKIDQADLGLAGIVRCLPSGCIADVIMNDALVTQFSNGETATFIIFETPEEGIRLPVSLKGFKEGLNALPR
jgi:invasion protein IalB